jgi:maltose alpha-D-glucosyltransferase/alpha-amylase
MDIRQQTSTAPHLNEPHRDQATPTFESASLSALLRGALPAPLQAVLADHIRGRRWFRGKARTIREIEVLDQLPLRRSAGETLVLIVRVSYVVEDAEVYVFPLARLSAADAERIAAARMRLFTLHSALEGDAVAYDPSGDADFSPLLLDLFVRERTPGDHGAITARPSEVLTARAARELPVATQAAGEQSNTTVLFGREFMLKLYRQLEAGDNPDVELNEFLWAHGYRHVPEPLGSVRYEGPALVATLGNAQRFVDSDGSAWDATLDILRRSLERTRGMAPPPADRLPAADLFENADLADRTSTETLVASYADFAALLGERTAELHLVLASDPVTPAFKPDPLTTAHLRSMVQGTRDRVDHGYGLLSRQRAELPQEVRPLAEEVFACRDRLRAMLHALDSIQVHASRIRCHGDYHLGQVLYAAGDFTILDFEGEPAQPLEMRRQKGSALYDVCGMLRSFHYAATVARQSDRWRREEQSSIAAWSEAWYRWASAAFVTAYMKRAREAGASAVFLPESRDELRALLRLHLIDKCSYELSYELNNRPAWVSVPMTGLVSLARAS